MYPDLADHAQTRRTITRHFSRELVLANTEIGLGRRLVSVSGIFAVVEQVGHCHLMVLVVLHKRLRHHILTGVFHCVFKVPQLLQRQKEVDPSNVVSQIATNRAKLHLWSHVIGDGRGSVQGAHISEFVKSRQFAFWQQSRMSIILTPSGVALIALHLTIHDSMSLSKRSRNRSAFKNSLVVISGSRSLFISLSLTMFMMCWNSSRSSPPGKQKSMSCRTYLQQTALSMRASDRTILSTVCSRAMCRCSFADDDTPKLNSSANSLICRSTLPTRLRRPDLRTEAATLRNRRHMAPNLFTSRKRKFFKIRKQSIDMEKGSETSILLLPPELLEEIFKFISFREIGYVIKDVNRQFKAVAYNIFQKEFKNLSKRIEKKLDSV
ncbi:hypothetical protein C0J52_21798, partial [Blattella germanica]